MPRKYDIDRNQGERGFWALFSFMVGVWVLYVIVFILVLLAAGALAGDLLGLWEVVDFV